MFLGNGKETMRKRIGMLAPLLAAALIGSASGTAWAQVDDVPPPPLLEPELAPPPPPPRFGLFGPRYYYGPRTEPLARFCATDAGTCTMRQLQPIASPCRCIIDGRRIGGEAVH
jgi:hypothetical protein